MRICANIANDDANKNKFKTLRQRRILLRRKKYKSKAKILTWWRRMSFQKSKFNY